MGCLCQSIECFSFRGLGNYDVSASIDCHQFIDNVFYHSKSKCYIYKHLRLEAVSKKSSGFIYRER